MRLTGELSTQAPADEPVRDGRRSPRTPVALGASLRRREGKAATVDIRDLSAHGFRAETAGIFSPGAQVWLRLPGLEAILARVAWTDRIHIGCEFERPLHPAVVERFTGGPTR